MKKRQLSEPGYAAIRMLYSRQSKTDLADTLRLWKDNESVHPEGCFLPLYEEEFNNGTTATDASETAGEWFVSMTADTARVSSPATFQLPVPVNSRTVAEWAWWIIVQARRETLARCELPFAFPVFSTESTLSS